MSSINTWLCAIHILFVFTLDMANGKVKDATSNIQDTVVIGAVHELHQTINAMKTVIEEQQHAIRLLQQQLEELCHPTVESPEERLQAQNTTVGFSAYHLEGNTNYTTGEVIEFSGVQYNYAASYDQDTSTFTCPLSGVYFFMSSLRNFPNLDFPGFAVDIMLNTEAIARVRAQYDTGDGDVVFLHGANGMLAQCSAGDRVQVQAVDNTSVTGNSRSKLSTFSGFLIGH